VPGNDTYPGVFADGCHRSWYRLEKVFFPPDCSGLFNKLKRIFVEFWVCRANFSGEGRGRFQNGLEIPTEMVVY
jgi:hypothetical protein